MSELKKYQCLVCEKVFEADPDEIKMLDYPECPECRKSNAKSSSFDADDLAYLAAKAVKTGAAVVSGIMSSEDKPLFESVHEFHPIASESSDLKRVKIEFKEQMPDISSEKNRNTGSMLQNVIGAVSKAAESIANQSSQKSNSVNVPDNWINIGNLNEAYKSGKLSQFRNYIGLYMHTIDGEVKYIGKAVEYNNGGLRKRLSDYCRDNNSARKHLSGRTIYENRDLITTFILVTGSDESAVEMTNRLEMEYINKYNPPWNVKHN